jgi:hypothetical protein
MLDAKKNRLYYDKLLKAPEGYEFDHAVTTSYSLDLEAILLVPIALFYSADFDFDLNKTRDDLIEALTKASERITIFCQRGKIRVPQPYNKLIAFWEKGIHQIQMPKYNQSFHPKIWLIRYVPLNKKNPVFYRFICTSRNLTFSRDWDIAISSEGTVDKKLSGENNSILDMLKYLDSYHKNKIPKTFFKEISKIRFDFPKNFSGITFHPIGISDQYANPVTAQAAIQDERLVVSPFLKTETIQHLSQKAKRLMLFSSEFELSQLAPALLDQIEYKYRFSPFVEDAEKMSTLSESHEIPMNQNLHAKLFIDRKGKNSSWFLGSANATQPASKGNIEFMVELKTTSKNLSPAKIQEQFLSTVDGGIALFEPYTGSTSHVPDNEIILEQQLRKLTHEISAIQFTGEAIENTNQRFDLIIQVPESSIQLPAGITARIRPLPEKNRAAVSLSLGQAEIIQEFQDYADVDLSHYIVIELWKNTTLRESFVLDMKIELSDSRLNKIFSSIINCKKRFLNYLFFLMSGETPDVHENELEEKLATKGLNMGTDSKFFADTPLYEKLLYTASRQKSKLLDINKLVTKIKSEKDENGDEIVSDEFLKMWKVFFEYAEKK